MKKFIALLLMISFLMPMMVHAAEKATPAQVADAQAAKKKAVIARDKGHYAQAAEDYQAAAALHPQEFYAALYLLNAEGCLVGTWNPARGYSADLDKIVTNKAKAQAILAQVDADLSVCEKGGWDYSPITVEAARAWYVNALDATNGVWH